MQKVIISVIGDIISDQRIDKVANSLINNNFKVLVVSRKLHNIKIIRNYEIKLFKQFFKKSFFMYAEFNIRLFLFLLFTKSNILLSNDLDTLLPNYLVSKIKRKKLVYDSHEYFTELPELINRKFVRKTWQTIEKLILPRIKNCYTVCQSIAEIYNKTYKIDMKVVRNLPVSNKMNINNFTENKKKIVIYQGALNIGRGIEYMIQSMKYLEGFELWILGDGTIKTDLELLTKNENLDLKVKFWGRIPFEKLNELTNQAILGLSLEENLGLNYYYALPNKIFDYIKANIPILASPFPEMKNIIEKYNIGDFIQKHDSKHIAEKIIEMTSNNLQIQIWKKNLEIASKELTWENEEKILLRVYNNLN